MGKNDLLAQFASEIEHICIDADGVLKGNEVRLLELLDDHRPVGFYEETIEGEPVLYGFWRACSPDGELLHPIRCKAGVIGSGMLVLEVADFNTLDGHAFERARKAGLTVDIITGRTESPAVQARMRQLPVHVHTGIKDKKAFIEQKLGYAWSTVAFIGDGVQDCPALEKAALSFAPADASDEAKKVALITTECSGGEGVAYEAIRAILEECGRWQ